MSTLPHDPTDLMQARVALEIDARLEQLGRLSVEELSEDVALESDTADWTAKLRAEGLLATVAYLIDTHGWELTWDPRGLRLQHDQHHIVLGVSATFTAFLTGPSAFEERVGHAAPSSRERSRLAPQPLH